MHFVLNLCARDKVEGVVCTTQLAGRYHHCIMQHPNTRAWHEIGIRKRWGCSCAGTCIRFAHRIMALAFHCCRTPTKASSSSASAVPGLSTHSRWRSSQLLPWLACRIAASAASAHKTQAEGRQA